MTRMRCRACKGIGFVQKRLTGVGPDGQPIDDGELHYCRCDPCQGAGFVDQNGKPIHEEIRL